MAAISYLQLSGNRIEMDLGDPSLSTTVIDPLSTLLVIIMLRMMNDIFGILVLLLSIHCLVVSSNRLFLNLETISRQPYLHSHRTLQVCTVVVVV